MHIKFAELPHDIQIDIIVTLQSYDSCHVEHANGKMSVQVSHMLKKTYADDEWISQEFKRGERFKSYFRRSWGDEWYNMCQGWEYMTNEEKAIMNKAGSIMLKARAESYLKFIQSEK